MLVFDTSVFINGWNYHYPPPAFRRLWDYVADCMDSGRVLAPREVWREIDVKTDDLRTWAKARRFEEPSEWAQRRVGQLQADYPRVFSSPSRNAADPWVIALAEERDWPVVSYEGVQVSGAPARPTRNPRMPDICRHMGITCLTPGPALLRLGFHL